MRDEGPDVWQAGSSRTEHIIDAPDFARFADFAGDWVKLHQPAIR
jgi:hypothetical protein